MEKQDTRKSGPLLRALKTLRQSARPVPVPVAPPLTADAVPMLMEGKWLTDIHHTIHASLLTDMVVVSPCRCGGRVAIDESAVFDLDDFLESYPDTRWVEMPA